MASYPPQSLTLYHFQLPHTINGEKLNFSPIFFQICGHLCCQSNKFHYQHSLILQYQLIHYLLLHLIFYEEIPRIHPPKTRVFHFTTEIHHLLGALFSWVSCCNSHTSGHGRLPEQIGLIKSRIVSSPPPSSSLLYASLYGESQSELQTESRPPPISWPPDNKLSLEWIQDMKSKLEWASRNFAPVELPVLLPVEIFDRLVLVGSKILHNVVVVGVIHGHLYDELFLLKNDGFPGEDMIFVFKPGSVYPLRGNHESDLDPPWEGVNLIPGDVLWSDPSMRPGLSPNEENGIGLLWGPDCTEDFLKWCQLKLFIRSHEGPDAREKRPGLAGIYHGCTIDHVVESGKLITMFSALNYPQFLRPTPTISAKDAMVRLGSAPQLRTLYHCQHLLYVKKPPETSSWDLVWTKRRIDWVRYEAIPVQSFVNPEPNPNPNAYYAEEIDEEYDPSEEEEYDPEEVQMAEEAGLITPPLAHESTILELPRFRWRPGNSFHPLPRKEAQAEYVLSIGDEVQHRPQ